MAEHFLTKSQIASDQFVASDGTRAVDRHAALQTMLERRAPQAAKIFAEPTVKVADPSGSATVSWYSEHDGAVRKLSDLDGAARSDAEATLSAALMDLRPLIDDPDDGDLVAQALYLESADDIYVVNRQPVLVNWGVLPKNLPATPEARLGHFAGTLGRYLPLNEAPPLTIDERTTRSDRLTKAAGVTAALATAGAATAASAGGSPVDPGADLASPHLDQVADGGAIPPGAGGGGGGSIPPTEPQPEVVGTSRWAWIPLLLLILIAALIAAWLLVPGNRLFQPSPVVLGDDGAQGLAEDVNRTLTERADALQAALDNAVCRDDGTLVLPDGTTPYGLLPPDPDAAPEDHAQIPRDIAPDGLLPPSPDTLEVPDPAAPVPESGETTEIPTISLLASIEKSTVMVIAIGGESIGSGSGFFVGPDLVLTNHHVIEDALNGGEVYVTNKVLGGVKAAEVLKTDGPFEVTGRDFALLRVPGVTGAPTTLRVSEASMKLQNVIAAGYPADVLGSDAAYQRLMQGDGGAVPELTVTDGIVNAEQTLSAATHLVVHSAPISTGNSGGPLLNLCGQIVGVNTFVRTGEMRNLNLALGTQDVVAFLQGTPVQLRQSSNACEPRVSAPTAPPREGGAETDEAPLPEGATPEAEATTE